MDLLNINNYEFVNDDPEVLLRIKNPASDTEITFLISDGTTMGDDQLYRVDSIGDLWFVVINNPLMQEKTDKSVLHNSEDYGVEFSQSLPLSFIIHSALVKIVEESERPSSLDL
jgi:hypothetical protein